MSTLSNIESYGSLFQLKVISSLLTYKKFKATYVSLSFTKLENNCVRANKNPRRRATENQQTNFS